MTLGSRHGQVEHLHGDTGERRSALLSQKNTLISP
jgi:hypothetical protein